MQEWHYLPTRATGNWMDSNQEDVWPAIISQRSALSKASVRAQYQIPLIGDESKHFICHDLVFCRDFESGRGKRKAVHTQRGLLSKGGLLTARDCTLVLLLLLHHTTPHILHDKVSNAVNLYRCCALQEEVLLW